MSLNETDISVCQISFGYCVRLGLRLVSKLTVDTKQ